MFTKAKWIAVTAGLAAVFLGAPAAHAQRGVNVAGINPYYQVSPGLNLQQAAFNTSVMGRAYSFVPPYALGYAPSYALGYGPGVGPFSPPYNGPTFGNPLLAASPFLNPGVNPALTTGGFNPLGNPYALNPFLGGASGTNPYLYGSAGTASLTTGGLPSNPGYDTASMAASAYSPYSGGSPYSGYYAPDPNTGYLRAGAEVIAAQGRFKLSTEQARLIQQQIERERIENRRRWVDELNYEREHMPTAEDDRQRAQKIYLRRSLNDPPVNEILSATALNTLLGYLEQHIDKGAPALLVPLDEDVLRRVNVTVPKGGNVGLLKSLKADGKLSWPMALRGDDFEKERGKLDALMPDAIGLAKEGKVDAGALAEMHNVVERMRQTLSQDLRDMTPAQGIEARRYLSNVDDALRALERPDAGNFLTLEWTAKGGTVADLVKNMKAKGLIFAPSVGGDENAYLALHRALAAYSSAVEGRQSTQTAERER